MSGGTGSVVGREMELRSVVAFLDAVPDGPSALVLAGEAGIGKTTLWLRGIELARERGWGALVTRPAEAETQLPFTGLGDLLAELTGDDIASLPSAPRRAIEIALLRADPGVEPLEQRAVGVGLLALLRRVAAVRPVVIAVDDVQWLDDPTRQVLQFALRRLGSEPVGALIAARTDRPAPGPLDLSRALPGDRATNVDVRPLDLGHIDRLLRAHLDAALPPSTLRRIHELSGGNPFFALEIGRALARQGGPASVGVGLPVPDTLRELVLERLYRLPGTTRDVLLAVAALGRPTLELVRGALGDESRVAAAIDRAEAAGVIELDGDLVRFTHPLLGSVLYGDLAPDARRRLHRRLAGAVADPDERARHLALGAVGPDQSVADALEAAATRTRARGAPDAAAGLADQARRLTPPDRADDRARRTLVAADAYLEAGVSSRAAELLEPLVDELAFGPDQARALLSLGRVRMFDAGLRQAEPLLERAAAAAGNDALLQASIGRDLATALTQTGDLRRAEAGARRTLEWAERTGVGAVRAAALVQVAMVEFLLGRGIRGELLDRAAAIGSAGEVVAAGSSAAYVPVDLVWGAILKWSDRFDEARRRFESVRRVATETGDETPWVSLLFQAGELELWAGNWDRAAAMADEAHAAADRRQPAMQQDHAYLSAAIDAHRGDLGAALRTTAVAQAQAERTGDLRFRIRALALQGFINLSMGDTQAATDPLLGAWALFRGAAYDDPGVIRFVPDLVEALVVRGDSDRAAELQGWLAERGATLDRPYALATAARCRALLLASAGDVDGARAEIDLAVDHHARLPQPFELARTALVQGTLLRRSKAKREAREALSGALATFEQLGAARWADRARAELGRIGGRAPTSTGLTPTEARVAQLAAEGYGNQEIAETLVVSAKTVEAHLTRIYDKLGVRSRGELARRSRSGEIPDFGGGSDG